MTVSPLLEVEDLTIAFPDADGHPRTVVSGMTFGLGHGDTLGLVGESGSGKTLTGLAVIGLLPPAARVSGRIRLDGADLLGLDDEAMSAVRGSRIAMIFQEPQSALNPAMRIGDQVAEGLVARGALGWTAARARAVELLDRVRIPAARTRASAYPHELSGGQRQRVGIAIALSLDPDLIIADEPTTALDATVQAEILDLLADLVDERRMSLILISHDLGVIARAAARTIVMYAGTRFEAGATEVVLARPLNPYMAGLMAARPRRRRTADERLTILSGGVPDAGAGIAGCRFGARCPIRAEDCLAGEPAWTSRDGDGRIDGRGVRCRHPLDGGKGAP